MSRWAVDREYAPRQAVGLCRFGELFSWFPDTGIISADAEQTQAKPGSRALFVEPPYGHAWGSCRNSRLSHARRCNTKQRD